MPARIRQFTGKSKGAEKQEFKGHGRGTSSQPHWALWGLRLAGAHGLLTVALQDCRHSIARFSMLAVEPESRCAGNCIRCGKPPTKRANNTTA